MGNRLLRLAMVLSLFGLGTFVYAFDNAGKWLAKGMDARHREDFPKAYQCFKMAAEMGNARAQYNLGYCYLTAQGVPYNEVEAARWFQKSADQGDPQGEFNLASCYENGWGLNQDLDKAKEYYQKSNQQGFAGADSALKRLSGVPAENGQSTETPAAGVTTNKGGEVSQAWVTQGVAGVNGRRLDKHYRSAHKKYM